MPKTCGRSFGAAHFLFHTILGQGVACNSGVIHRELKWQGEIVDGQHSYRDESGELLGEAALATMWQAANPMQEIHAA